MPRIPRRYRDRHSCGARREWLTQGYNADWGLPGATRAALRTLRNVWRSGFDLRTGPSAEQPRLQDLARIECGASSLAARRTPPSQSIRSGACSRTGRSSRESDHFASRAFFGCQTGLFLAKRLGDNSSGRRRSVYFRPSCSHHFVGAAGGEDHESEHLGVGCGAQIGYKPLHIRIGKSGMMACDVLGPASEASRGAVSSTRLDCENPCHRRLSSSR